MTRRHLLAGAGAALVVAACGSDVRSDSARPPIAPSRPTPRPSRVRPGSRSHSGSRATRSCPGQVRLPISIADKDSLLETGPAALNGRVLDSNDKEIATVSAPIHATGLVDPLLGHQRADRPAGLSTPCASTATTAFGAAFQSTAPERGHRSVHRFAAAAVRHADRRQPPRRRAVLHLTPNPCPFHDVTLTEALAPGKPVVYMVGTPAHCQTGTCAPALEFLVESARAARRRGRDRARRGLRRRRGTTVAPAVSVVRAGVRAGALPRPSDGRRQRRIDVIWDQSELDERLDAFLA